MHDYEKSCIYCVNTIGPWFGKGDMFIYDKCNIEGGGINNGRDNTTYSCKRSIRSSLFVDTAGPDEYNYFIVSDY